MLDIVPVDRARTQPVLKVAHAARTDFLAGLVTTETGMVALIDIDQLLSAAISDGAEIEGRWS